MNTIKGFALMDWDDYFDNDEIPVVKGQGSWECPECGHEVIRVPIETIPRDTEVRVHRCRANAEQEVARLTAIIEEARKACFNGYWPSYVDAILAGGKPPTKHIPDRNFLLTSNPPKYYCNNENGERNRCYCHPCDWSGWDG